MLYFSRLGHFGGSQSEGAARCREPLLRQQLLVLQRRHPQARLRNADRQCASRWFAGWRNSLLIVKPETVLRWHRRGWRA